MKRIAITAAILLTALTLQACTTGTDGSSATAPTTTGSTTTSESETNETTGTDEAAVIELTFDFNKGDEGFTAGFADLPVDYNEEIYGLDSGMKDLPEELGDGQGYYVTGMNRSDDLFIFLSKELSTGDGVLTNQAYDISFEIEFGSNAFANSFGIGGSPAESVYVKAGASSIRPEVIEGKEGDTAMFQMNIDKGQQSEGGTDAQVIGNVAKQDGSEDESFAIVSLSSDSVDLSVESDTDGRIWLIVGIDSGFEGTTELYFTKISVKLTPID